jgi:hypothetical protein
MAAEPLVTPNSAGERAIARPAGYLLRRRAGLDVIAARLDGGDRRGSERATRDGPPVLGRTSGRISGNYPCATPLRTSTLRVVAKRSRERKTRCKERGRAVPPAVPLRPLAMVDVAERSARGTAASSSVDRTGALLSLSGEKGWSSPIFLWPPLASLSRVCARPRARRRSLRRAYVPLVGSGDETISLHVAGWTLYRLERHKSKTALHPRPGPASAITASDRGEKGER